MASRRGVETYGSRPTESKIVDMSKLYELEPEASPLIAFTQKLNKVERTDNPRFDIQALRPLAQTGLCSSYLVSDTTITVTDSSWLNVNDRIVNLRTYENMLVTAIPSSTTITVTRAVGSTSAVAGNDNDRLARIGQALPEASSIPEANLNQEDYDYNYCQIFRESYDLSETLKASKTYSGDEKKKRIRQISRKLKGDMEFAAVFGERGIQDSTGKARRFTRGLKPVISTNSYNPNSTISYTNFVDNVLVPAGRYGSSMKLLFAGENLLRCLHQWGREKLLMSQDESVLGFNITRIKSAFVDLMVVRCPLFRDSTTAKMGFIVDPENMKRRELRGLRLESDRQANDYDGEKGELIAEAGFEFALEETHMWIEGINGPA